MYISSITPCYHPHLIVHLLDEFIRYGPLFRIPFNYRQWLAVAKGDARSKWQREEAGAVE